MDPVGFRLTPIRKFVIGRTKLILVCFLTSFLLFKVSKMVTDKTLIHVGKDQETLRFLHNVLEWPSRQTMTCGGNFTGYANKLFRMKSAVFVPDTDSFQLMCKNGQLPPSYSFIDNDYGVGKYLLRIGHMTEAPPAELRRQNGVTVIVDRCNAHNYYHAMQEWYNLYLTAKLFNYEFKGLQVFIIDRIPYVHIDVHWNLLFSNLLRVKDLKSPIIFEDALFNHAGPGNPWGYRENDKPPYIEDFSQEYLSAFNLVSDKVLDCHNLTITLGIRRDYYMNPLSKVLQKRNTQRKFKNEVELLRVLQQSFTGHNIRTLVAEDMAVKDQVKLATETDILVAMHGCIFTNTLFMPRHGAIFEMYPKYWKIKDFFSEIAGWRGIRYAFWRNDRKENEYSEYRTYIPPDVLVGNVNNMRERIGCTA